MKKTIGLLLTLTIVLLTLFLAGCGNSTSSPSKDSEEPKFVNGKLTKEFELKTPTFTGFNEFIIADLKGFFKEVNIKPVYTGVLAQGSNLAQSVIKGDNDLFGSGHPTNIAVARKAGAKIKIVLHSMVDSPENNKLHMTWLDG
ncbi:substrate-binding domain-containing protein [Paenibacillus durus]|uniref:hypothetical protein n=1 Tax=Paenibacillus durus TaxID=44251 RepID=UPI000694A83A|nr:hypothetical protein [Paenibacillus durus]